MTHLKTPALRAGYLQYLEAIQKGAGQAVLERRLDVAFHERMRYFANRIAQTELARAHADRQALEIMDDAEVGFVRWRMSGTHPRTDICDYLAKADRYGLGPGIYPKHLAPKPPAHPHCRCILQPLTGLNPATKWRERPGAAQAWLREQGLNEGAAVMGSRARRDAVLKGADPLALWNERSDPLYRVRMVREGADGGGLAQQLAASSAVKPMDNARMLPRIPQDMLNGLIARGEAMADKGFMALWTEPSSAERHTRRRIQRGDVVDEHDYIAKTLGVFKEAERIVVVTPINPVMRHTGKVAMISGEWIVLLAENGGIVTSYPHRPNEFETFEQKHAAYGDRIDDYAIPDDIRSRLASLFRRY